MLGISMHLFAKLTAKNVVGKYARGIRKRNKKRPEDKKEQKGGLIRGDAH